MKKYLVLLGALALLALSLNDGWFAAAPVAQAAAGATSVSVTGVSVAPNPALGLASTVTVSATVTPTYDSPSGPTTVVGNCQGKTKVTTTTAVAVSNQSVIASATDVVNTNPSLSGSSPGGGVFSGSLPTRSPDGKYTVTVTATVSDDVTTTVTTETATYPSAPCSGTPSIATETQTTTATNSNSASASATYVVDQQAPTWGPNPTSPDVHPTTVPQGGFTNVHIHLEGGSAGTSYTWTATATGPATYSFTDTGTFGASGTGNGIAPPENAVNALNFPCSAPLGTYTVTVTVNAVDLGGNAWNDPGLTDVVAGTVTVTPGVSLEATALVVAEIPGGDYATLPYSGFSIVTGSEHTALIISFAGECVGQSTVDLGEATLTLPPGFAFDKNGGSPQVHWFEGPAAPGFDLHYPAGYTEKTAKPKISVLGSTATVKLDGLGTIPTSDAIYMRAHIKWVGPGTPPAENVFTDTVSATKFNGDSSFGATATATYDLTYP
jgi:hypothetical protein